MKLTLSMVLILPLLVAACGSSDDPGSRTAGGAGVGAATGAGIGLLFGGIGAIPGALIGGAVGAGTGAVTDDETVNIGEPVWK